MYVRSASALIYSIIGNIVSMLIISSLSLSLSLYIYIQRLKSYYTMPKTEVLYASE